MAHATEALRRCEGLRYHDVQLIAGGVLAGGGIAEVATGEGKTLITALPAVCQIVRGRSVHVWTTNEYLARRDFDRLRPIFRTLGITTSRLERGRLDRRPLDYRADVLYGPGYEFGFDYLRDQSDAWRQRNLPLGSRYMERLTGTPPAGGATAGTRRAVIVDEADSVLIDEAGVPLVMGEHHDGRVDDLDRMRAIVSEVRRFTRDDEFRLVAGRKIVWTSAGATAIRRFARSAGSSSISRPVELMFRNAVTAAHVFRRDVDYVVTGGKVAIVDPHTGRIDPDRRWQDGLHAAVEIVADVATQTPVVSVTRITRQRFIARYEHICGMTGTAMLRFQLSTTAALVELLTEVHRGRHDAAWRIAATRLQTSMKVDRVVLYRGDARRLRIAAVSDVPDFDAASDAADELIALGVEAVRDGDLISAGNPDARWINHRRHRGGVISVALNIDQQSVGALSVIDR